MGNYLSKVAKPNDFTNHFSEYIYFLSTLENLSASLLILLKAQHIVVIFEKSI